MDLAWLRAHPETLPRLVEHQRIRITTLAPGTGGVTLERWTLDDGTDLFAKLRPDAPPGFLAAEGDGLRWLAEANAVAVPEVIAALDGMLVTTWVARGPATPAGAAAFGRDLAALHRAGAPSFGLDRPGWLATLPLDNTPAATWPEFYVERRCRPFLRAARDRGALTGEETARVEGALDRVPAAAGPPEPPARLHGDLWIGNVLPGADGRWWLVDPAAHGGHRETDLAMLALFGAPHLAGVLDAYAEVAPLADGWRDRVPLHQLHPLLVHCALFGADYARQTLEAAATVR